MTTMIVKAVLDLETMQWESVERVPYEGEWALCDRAANQQAKNAEQQAVGVSQQEQQNATNEHAALTPFYRQEMNAQHLFNPTQTSELLNYAGAATGGSGAAATGEANSQAARTRNTSGFSSALDQNARDRAQEMAKANASVGAEDVLGAKQLNQQGAAGMAGLYGTDTNAMLGAMGQEAGDINAEVNANNSGWYQKMLAGINTGANLIGALKKPA